MLKIRAVLPFCLLFAAMPVMGQLAPTEPASEYVRMNGSVVAAIRKPAAVFTDAFTTTTFSRTAHIMKDRQITNGCTATSYCPTFTHTRGEMAVFVIRAINIALSGDGENFVCYPYGSPMACDSPNMPQYFNDVQKPIPPSQPGHMFFKYISKMKELGITAGCGDGTVYCPNDPLENYQMAVFAVRGLWHVRTGAMGSQLNFPSLNPSGVIPAPTIPQVYPDVPSYMTFYLWVQKAYELQLLGTARNTYCWGSNFCPTRDAWTYPTGSGDPGVTTREFASIFVVRGILGDKSF